MRAYVFTDASLARYAGRFVWLSVDIDDPKSAGFVSKYKSPGIPTFFVIDPKGESVSTRYVGGFTVASLKKFLDGHGAVTKTPGEEALTRADQLASQNKHAEALAAYEEALKALPKKSLRANRAAEGLVMSLQMTDNSERCASQGLELARSLSGTVSGANIASMALDCASGLKPEQRNAENFAALEKIVGDAVASKTLDLSGDDRSGYYIVLIGARDAVKDETGGHKLREQWSAFLDREAARAKTNEERAVYDPHRLVAYMELNQTAKAVPMLELTAKQFPNDYNPFSRLAAAYRNMKMWNEAVFYGRKAVAKSQGPRRLSIYIGLTDAYLGNGDKASARATMQEAIAYAEALPEGQRSAGAIGNLKRKMESIQ